MTLINKAIKENGSARILLSTGASQFPFFDEFVKEMKARNIHLAPIIDAGVTRIRPILMTSLTTILALLPFLSHGSMGAAIQYPLSLTLIIGMTIGTAVSLFFIPMLYYLIAKLRMKS